MSPDHTSSPGEDERLRYYTASLRALRFLEARRPTGRRFGPDADARWKEFRGDLGAADRVDLLIRDADAQWPGAFGAHTAFGLRAMADDEPFGAEWVSLEPVAAEELWRQILDEREPANLREALEAVAFAWGLRLEWPSIPAIDASQRVFPVGASATAGVALVFAESRELDWATQVVPYADVAGPRHLAALTGALLGITSKVTFADAPPPADPESLRADPTWRNAVVLRDL